MGIRKTLQSIIFGSGLLLFGCNDRNTLLHFDNVEPSAPRGLVSVTGDGYVFLSWLPNPESDISGYDIYRGNSCSGQYSYLASTNDTSYVDNDVFNGNTYYYAVAAFDLDAFQSDLSYNCVFDTPRPEGDVVLYDFNTSPSQAGFDFAAQNRVAYNSGASDIYLELFAPSGTFYVNANSGTLIQDFGYVDTLSQVDWAPPAGWSDLGYVEAILGHAYIINTWDNHYAKIRVNQIGTNYVQLQWAYQVDQDNPELAAQKKPTSK